MDWAALLEKDPTGIFKKLTTKEKAPKDPIMGYRSKLLRSLDKSAAAHKEGKARGPVHKQLGNYCRVQFQAGRGKDRRTIPLNGNDFNMVPSERFPEFVSGFKSHVESGGFDNELRSAYEGGVTGSNGRQRRRMSPEALAARNAKRAATLAAKKAKKAL